MVFGFPFMLEQLLFTAYLTESASTSSDFPILLVRRQVFRGLFRLFLNVQQSLFFFCHFFKCDSEL